MALTVSEAHFVPRLFFIKKSKKIKKLLTNIKIYDIIYTVKINKLTYRLRGERETI